MFQYNNSITNELVDNEDGFNYSRSSQSVAFDIIFSNLELDFLDNVNIGKTLKNINIDIAKLNNRKNKKWASNQIAQLTGEFNNLFSLKIYEEFTNGSISIAANSIVQNAQARAK